MKKMIKIKIRRKSNKLLFSIDEALSEIINGNT